MRLHRLGKLEEPQRISDVASALADDPGDIFLIVVELIHQGAIAVGLFERIEIGALHIFDNGDLQRLGIRR